MAGRRVILGRATGPRHGVILWHRRGGWQGRNRAGWVPLAPSRCVRPAVRSRRNPVPSRHVNRLFRQRARYRGRSYGPGV